MTPQEAKEMREMYSLDKPKLPESDKSKKDNEVVVDDD